MLEKVQVVSTSRDQRPQATMTSRITRLLVLVLLALFATLWHIKVNQNDRIEQLRQSLRYDTSQPNSDRIDSDRILGTKTGSIPTQLEAHIMSKCPDAMDCIVDQILPVMSSLPSNMVNLTISYIGQVTDPDDGVSCRHGPQECLGNIMQLCAAKLYPDPKQFLGFLTCTIKQYSLIPQRELLQNCAAEYGIDFEKLNDCASQNDGSYGVGLLRDSVERSRKAGITLSCTVRVNEKVRCIRDGGEWKDCPGGPSPQTIANEIKNSYHDRNRL